MQSTDCPSDCCSDETDCRQCRGSHRRSGKRSASGKRCPVNRCCGRHLGVTSHGSHELRCMCVYTEWTETRVHGEQEATSETAECGCKGKRTTNEAQVGGTYTSRRCHCDERRRSTFQLPLFRCVLTAVQTLCALFFDESTLKMTRNLRLVGLCTTRP